MPHQGIDPLVAGSALVQALQTLTSRNLSPLDSGVVSVTQIHGGDIFESMFMMILKKWHNF